MQEKIHLPMLYGMHDLIFQIFTDRQKTEHSSNLFAPEVVLECLKHYRTALMLYLEHLVFVHKSEVCNL